MSEIYMIERKKGRNIAKVVTLLLSLSSVLPMYSCGGEAQTDNTQSGATASDESSAEETNSLPASIATLPKCDETT